MTAAERTNSREIRELGLMVELQVDELEKRFVEVEECEQRAEVHFAPVRLQSTKQRNRLGTLSSATERNPCPRRITTTANISTDSISIWETNYMIDEKMYAP